MKKTKTNRPALIGPIMMISDRHKTNNLVTLFCCLCLSLMVAQANGNGTTTSMTTTTTTTSTATATATKTNANQDEVNGLALTPDVTTAARLDHNNNNEWRPLGHGDPLQKDPTYDYSPPALDRVRYWAENNASGQTNPEARKKELPPEVLRNKTKSEILLLGVASERDRERERERGTRTGQQVMHYPQRHSSYANIMPSKYPPIRRSYYAPQQQQQQQQQHQQHQQQQQQLQQQQLQQQQHYMPHTHLMPPPPMSMIMKGLEYRSGAAPYHSLSHMSSSSKQPMTISSHHYYSSPSTSNWLTPHRMTYTPDAYHQETMQHFSYSRPQANSMSYSPNSLHGHHTKPVSPVHRKPWLHELLQKELVKPKVKPTMPATKYLMGTTKPFTMAYTPVSFVSGPPTIAGPTVVSPSDNQIISEFRPMMMITSTVPSTSYITTTTTTAAPITTTTPTTTTTPMPIYQRPTSASSSMISMSNTGYTGNRLLIPQTSNLAQRPTVATAFDSDIRQTTDSLFSHYKQPPKALLGPAYLIIEGHSKVKTYGQNELDPHSPKIVPVISKREPIVRLADPNEPKRGTVETFQVKHLHTKTTPMIVKTTGKPSPSTKTTTTTTTTKPLTITTTTMKPLKTTVKTSISSTTRLTPRITAPAAASTTTTTTTPTPAIITTTTTTTANGVHDLLSLLDNMFADAHEIVSPNASSSALLSSPTLAPINYVTSTMSTILKPVSTSTKLLPQQQPEPRIKSQAANSILSLDEEEDDDDDERSEIIASTELPLRATRQVFDYDQLPESRIKDKEDGLTAAVDYMDVQDEEEETDELGEAELEAASLNEDEDEQDEDGNIKEEEVDTNGEQVEDVEHNLLKRIDQFVDDIDDGDDDLDDLIENLDDEEDGEIAEQEEDEDGSQERRNHQH